MLSSSKSKFDASLIAKSPILIELDCYIGNALGFRV